MKILKKLIVSIVMIMIIISSILPSSSNADFTSTQQTQMQQFLDNYLATYGGKTTYSQGKYRDNIYDYKFADEHTYSVGREPKKDIYGTITADCSSFASFVYNSTCNRKWRGWMTDTFGRYTSLDKDDGYDLYSVRYII